MKVFISWSNPVSQQIALLFRDWLPQVIQLIKPYVSSEDIDKGTRWLIDIAQELNESSYGIICVTKENMNAPWINFEAGALSKKLGKSFVSPFLFDLKPSDVTGPLVQFQQTIFDKEDIRKLLYSINTSCGDERLSDQLLEKSFERCYLDLESGLKLIREKHLGQNLETNSTRDIGEMVEEILDTTRSNLKISNAIEQMLPPNFFEEQLKLRKQQLRRLKHEAQLTDERIKIKKEHLNTYSNQLDILILELFKQTRSYDYESVLVDKELFHKISCIHSNWQAFSREKDTYV